MCELWSHAEKERRAKEYEESLERPRQPTLKEELTLTIKRLRNGQKRSLIMASALVAGALAMKEGTFSDICMTSSTIILFGNLMVYLIIFFLKIFGGLNDNDE